MQKSIVLTFADLCARYGVHPDSHGEAHIDCPFCGKEAKSGQTHFSFSAQGGHCFVCGQSCSLKDLAERIGMDATAIRAEPKRQKRQTPIDVWRDLQNEYQVPARYEAWQRYKPISRELIDAYGLGLGATPYWRKLTKCNHERLQVPLINTLGMLCGFRSRTIDCACDKWLSPAGTRMILYNGQRIGSGQAFGIAHGDRRAAVGTLLIAENPIDAILAETLWDVSAVGVLGVTNWQDAWTEALLKAPPDNIIVMFDNDRPGNGGGIEGRKQWMAKHGRDMLPNGVKLVNRLLGFGLRARLFDWSGWPLGADLGDMIAEEEEQKHGNR